MEESPSDPKSKKKQAPGTSYAKYSALGIQVAMIAALFAFAGVKLDQYFETETPWFTLVLSIVGVSGGMIQLIRSIK